MKRLVLMVVVAACGPPDVPGEVDVTSATCMLTGPTMFTVRAEAQVSIDVGQTIGLDVALQMATGSASFTNEYQCAGWTDYKASGDGYSYGCRRDAGQPPDEAIVFFLDYTYQATLPASPKVDVTAILFSATEDNRSEDQAPMTVACTP